MNHSRQAGSFAIAQDDDELVVMLTEGTLAPRCALCSAGEHLERLKADTSTRCEPIATGGILRFPQDDDELVVMLTEGKYLVRP